MIYLVLFQDKIDNTMTMLQNADPTGETVADHVDMVNFEGNKHEICKYLEWFRL